MSDGLPALTKSVSKMSNATWSTRLIVTDQLEAGKEEIVQHSDTSLEKTLTTTAVRSCHSAHAEQ